MEAQLQTQMLNAIELFHYSYRFRNHTFVIALENTSMLEQIIVDLRVLASSHISFVLHCKYEEAFTEKITTLNEQGYSFKELVLEETHHSLSACAATIPLILSEGRIPIVVSKSDTHHNEIVPNAARASTLTKALGAKKLFFVTSKDGLIHDGKFLSYPLISDVEQCLLAPHKLNVSAEHLGFLLKLQQQGDFDVILLGAQSGSLFSEIFTHRGSGTLFTHKYLNECRAARPNDVRDIALLMKPYIETSLILPVSEKEVFEHISDYFLYTVNDEPVASAKLTDYGAACEVAKFCTLPRYQRRGRARLLAQAMIEAAKSQDKEYVFALSIEPAMRDFFEGLGFKETKRESLPEEWKRNYDFARNSTAYKLML